MPDQTNHYPLSSYSDSPSAVPVFRLRAVPQFSPLDLNLAFLFRSGWNQSVDRLRFHFEHKFAGAVQNPLTNAFDPHLLIRRLDRDEDCFASVHAFVKGEILVLTNDASYAHHLIEGIFLECPPSFHTLEDLVIEEEWCSDPTILAMFTGMLAGAMGWDPSHSIPDNVRLSLEEARRSLEIANYRSCVAMSRRTLEAVLKFGYERLLGKPPVNKRGFGLMLNEMIQDFRSRKPLPIPEHLLHIANAIRLIGNVPGAHASDLANYHFSRSDAEFALYATTHFLDQYFSKIDQEVSTYYQITIDLSESKDVQNDPA